VAHDLLQPDHASNDDTTQCAGHAPRLHASVPASAPAAIPPQDGSVAVRERTRVPLPHVIEHAPHVAHSLITASTGQQCSLQERTSRKFEHSTPPKLTGVVTERVRSCEPTLHEAEQADHAPKSETTQSTEHELSLQPRVSSRYGHT
jgi:hypothetical protein